MRSLETQDTYLKLYGGALSSFVVVVVVVAGSGSGSGGGGGGGGGIF